MYQLNKIWSDSYILLRTKIYTNTFLWYCFTDKKYYNDLTEYIQEIESLDDAKEAS